MDENLVQIFGQYKASKLDENTWIIQFMNASQYMYLLEGAEKALLIDTGYGAGNLKDFVRGLTDKPLLVVNTHFHPDHAGGNGEFKTVYMSATATVDAPSVTNPGATPFDLSKLPYPSYEKKYVKEGDCFLLGQRKVEIMEAKPAHCNSSLFFLDREHRMLFVGDEFESAQVLMFDNSKNPQAPYDIHDRLRNLKSNALRLNALHQEYDFVLPNHNGTPIAKEYLQAYADLVDAIYAKKAVVEDKLNHPFIEMDPMAEKLCRVRWGDASIFVEKEQVMKCMGKRIQREK